MPDPKPQPGAPLLHIAGLKKHFGATKALDGVDLRVATGEVHALIGENGAGKSTLLNILSAAIRPGAGDILFRGRPYRPADPLEARRLGIAHIHQELSLCANLSVAENIFLGAEPQRAGWLHEGAMNRLAGEILESFPHPALTPTRRTGDLTIAARQVVEICRALAQHALLILMDEPTSSLQRADVDRLFEFIRKLRRGGVSVIYVSHFLEEVREISDTFTVLRDGQSVLSGRLADVTDAGLVTAMVGRPVRDLFPARNPGAKAAAGSVASPVALRVKGLRAPPAVLDAGFELRRGEVLGIFGLIGAGRTQLLRALFGLDRAKTGEIAVGEAVHRDRSDGSSDGSRAQNEINKIKDGSAAALGCDEISPAGPEIETSQRIAGAGVPGKSVSARWGVDAPARTKSLPAQPRAAALQNSSPARRIAAGIGYLSEDRKGEGLAASLSVADNITLTNFASCSRLGWIDLEQQRRQSGECARTVGVKAQTMGTPVGRLSGGNQQKVALARLLHQGCEIFLLDEPTRGVDVGSKAQIYELIVSLAASGKAVLMVSSYLPELFGICDRLAVMRRGHLLPARPIAEWTPETVLQEAIGG